MKKKTVNPAVKFLQENLVSIGIILLMVVTAVINPTFISASNLTNVLRQLGALPFVALGMTFVIIGGFIDLSVPGILSLTAVVAVTLVDPLGQVGAIVVALLLGAALGYLNGVVLTGSGAMTQAEVLFITYGMSSVFMAIGLLFTNAETLRLMRSTKPITIFETLSSTVGIVPVIVIVFVVLLVVMHIFLNKTLAGRSVTLLGGNKDAAYLCGFNTKRCRRRHVPEGRKRQCPAHDAGRYSDHPARQLHEPAGSIHLYAVDHAWRGAGHCHLAGQPP